MSSILLYPNPTLADITIDLGDVETGVRATLTNYLGQIVFDTQFEAINLFKITLDTPAGVYFLQLKTSNGDLSTMKVIKK